MIQRRRLVAGPALAAAAIAAPAWAQVGVLTDSSGRKLTLPRRVERVLPAGTPAAIKLYTLAPETLIGWPRANPPDALEFLLPGIATRPTVGWITSRGNAANLEEVLGLRPDLIVDSGVLAPTYVELADRVQAQTGVPYALLDGSFTAIARSYGVLGALIGRRARARELAQYVNDMLRSITARVARVPQAQRPRVYYARGPAGLDTGLGGSINIEILEFMGLPVVSAAQRGGMGTVSIEQVLHWNPDVIVTIDPDFAASVRDNPLWKGVRAVREGRVHLAPKSPFNWFDFPPGVNRLPGLWWLGKLMYPAQLTSASVAAAGVVGWVGLVVPHLARFLVGPSFARLLPATALLGAGLLLFIDTLARSLAAVEVPLGVLTAVVGTPFFLWLLRGTQRGWA